MWANWLHNPCQHGGPNASREDDNRPGYLSSAILGAHMWAKWLHNHCHPGGHQRVARG